MLGTSGIATAQGWPQVFEPVQGATHLGFGLAAAGEEIGLCDTDARGSLRIDAVSIGPQGMDLAQARCPDGFAVFQTLVSGSPGAPNLGSAGCTLGGTAQRDSISVEIDGLMLTLVTFAGERAEDVARAQANAINADAAMIAGWSPARSAGRSP